VIPGRRVPRWVWLGAAAALAVGAPAVAGAEPGDVVVAEALFRDGKDLLAKSDYEHACAKLAESFRLDAASGTLLALAICHERQGKFASAWGEYTDVASRSKLESRADRERAARGKASELEPKVSRITVILSGDAAATEGIRVKRNGAFLSSALLGTAVPVDGGAQVVEATAPGKKAWRAKVTLKPSGDNQTLTVPELDDDDAAGATAPPQVPTPAPAVKAKPGPPPSVPTPSKASLVAAPPAAPPAAESPGEWSPLQITGVATGAAGLLGLGAGTVFVFKAMSRFNDSKPLCNGDLCTAEGKQDRIDARYAGNLATAGFIEGGMLTTAGIVMYLLGRRSHPASGGAPAASLQLLPLAGPQSVAGVVRGIF
jgi:hypothetical protein